MGDAIYYKTRVSCANYNCMSKTKVKYSTIHEYVKRYKLPTTQTIEEFLHTHPPPSICKFNLRIRSNTDILMNRLQYNEKERSKSLMVVNIYNYQLTFKYSHNWCIYTVNVKSLSFSFTRIKQNKYSDVKHDTKQKN